VSAESIGKFRKDTWMKSQHLSRMLSSAVPGPSKTVNYRVINAGDEVDSGWVPEASPGRSSAALVAWMTARRFGSAELTAS
jgi:hypothetical protein